MMRKYLPPTSSSTLKRPSAVKPTATPSYESVTNQNSRIQSIRQKYSYSKEKNNLFTLRRQDNTNDNPKTKEPIKQPLKENISFHTRANTEISAVEQRKSRQVLGKDINRDNINEILNRSGSIEYSQLKQRHKKSKQKVIQRMDNINKIRDKINNLISKYDIGSSKPSTINNENITRADFNSSLGRKGVIKRNNLNQDRDLLNTSLTDSIKQLNLSSELCYRSRDSRSSSSSNLHSHSVLLQRPSIKKLDQTFHSNMNTQNDAWTRPDESTYLHKFSSTQPRSSLSIKSSKRQQSSLRNSTQSSCLNTNKQTQIKHLISSLCRQIQYDEQFRVSKYLFHLNTRHNKHNRLLEEFERRGIESSIAKLKQEMKFYQDEYDPFIQQEPQQDYSKYADSLIASDKNWQQNIKRKFSYHGLIEDGIRASLKCQNNRIQVADLVRFVNLNSGKLFKNRDLVIIMRRISEGKAEIEMKDVWRALCHDYE